MIPVITLDLVIFTCLYFRDFGTFHGSLEFVNFHYSLKVNYHPIYSMNNFVTNKSKLPQDLAQLFPYMG